MQASARKTLRVVAQREETSKISNPNGIGYMVRGIVAAVRVTVLMFMRLHRLIFKGPSHMKLSILVMSLLLPASSLYAQENTSIRPPSVTAQGEAFISAEPDQAQIDVGVLTQARTAPEAAKENAEKLGRVLAQIKKLLGEGDELKTTGYALNPNYRYPQGGKPEITGYTAANVLQIRTGNLAGVGKLIDAGMQAGANQINRLVFTLKDEHSAQVRALRMATQKAQSKAEEMSGSLGLKVVRVLSLTENERGVRPIIAQRSGIQAEALSSAAPTPVEAGTIEVRSSVTLTAEIAPARP